MIESSRMQWEDARVRLERESDIARQEQLFQLVEKILAQLRRELGSVFSLRELDATYAEADRWVIHVVAEALPREKSRTGPADATLIQDAAFDLYARGAYDYEP